MLPDILNYIPDPKNGRPIADGQAYFFLGGYSAPSSIADVNPAFIAEVTANGNPVPQPIYTSKGGTLIVGSQTNQPQLNVDPLVKRVAVYDKCGRLVYSTAYNGVGAFVDADALAAPGSTVLVGGVAAGKIAKRVNQFVFIDDFAHLVVDGDWTNAFKAALVALDTGGKLWIPKRKYKLTDEIVLRSGVRLMGENAADNIYGQPPDSTSVQTYIWQATAGKAIFVIPDGVSDIHFSGIAFAASEFMQPYPLTTPKADGRHAIKCEGSWPKYSWFISVEDCLFYDVDRGISIVDPFAGANTPQNPVDWNCAPMTIARCRFLYPQYGMWFETNNADVITVSNCVFSVPANGAGVKIIIAGYLLFQNCNSGGAQIENNVFFDIVGRGPSSLDNITLHICQAETLTQFIRYISADPGTANRFKLTLNNCIAELGAESYFKGKVHLISSASRWSSNVFIDSEDVRISSYDDTFNNSASFVFLSSNPSIGFVNFTSGPDSIYQDVAYVNGAYRGKGIAPPASGTYKIGDTQLNKDPNLGEPVGWVCTNGGSIGTWTPQGQVGFRTSNGTPVGVLTPTFVGEEILNTANGSWWKSVGDTINSWTQIG